MASGIVSSNKHFFSKWVRTKLTLSSYSQEYHLASNQNLQGEKIASIRYPLLLFHILQSFLRFAYEISYDLIYFNSYKDVHTLRYTGYMLICYNNIIQYYEYLIKIRCRVCRNLFIYLIFQGFLTARKLIKIFSLFFYICCLIVEILSTVDNLRSSGITPNITFKKQSNFLDEKY